MNERLEFMPNEEMERNEQLPEIKIEVAKIADSIGYGDGAISYEARKSEVGAEILQAAENAINSKAILAKVDVDEKGNMLDDDGCSDGRVWGKLFEKVNGAMRWFKRSLNRPKVFGGGITMGTAAMLGLGEADGQELNQAFSTTVERFQDKMIGFGAHTDSHNESHPKNCGCGAIDKAPQILSNALKFEDKIRGTLTAFGIDNDDPGVGNIFGNLRSFSNKIDAEAYSGKEVSEAITENGGFIKELAGDHLEMYIVLNNVEGYTVDQHYIREISDDKVQVFAVDVWRLKQLAQRLYDNDTERHQAFVSMLVYTLATAATLTKGDLPVYSVDKQPDLVAA
jgi:hypothetical protein